MKKTIYVDMDGVLSDFEAKYVELFGETPERTRMDRDKSVDGSSTFSKRWNEFIDKRGFEYLNKFQGCDELVRYLKSLKNIDIKILTSTGGAEHHNRVLIQKVLWVELNSINFPVVAVPGRRFKSVFANNSTFLIDDTLDVVESFYHHGGQSILHKNVADTKFGVECFLRS
jgi:hypothetical protein